MKKINNYIQEGLIKDIKTVDYIYMVFDALREYNEKHKKVPDSFIGQCVGGLYKYHHSLYELEKNDFIKHPNDSFFNLELIKKHNVRKYIPIQVGSFRDYDVDNNDYLILVSCENHYTPTIVQWFTLPIIIPNSKRMNYPMNLTDQFPRKKLDTKENIIEYAIKPAVEDFMKNRDKK